MKKARNALLIFLWLILALPSYSAQDEEKAPKKPRPLEDIQDILAWKSIRSPLLSNNGEWFAYRLSPQEGDGEVIIRNTKTDKEYTFSAGEVQGFSQDILFSDDSLWVAFTLYPQKEEAKKLKKQKKKRY